MTNYATDETNEADPPLYCAKHPDEPTYLRCGRCEKPICAKCRVSTPVGFRCYECANLQSVPTYAIDNNIYVKALVAGLLVGVVAGVLMGLFPAFEFWAALLMGVAVPEAIALMSNQKRGPGLQMVGIACIVVGFLLSRFVLYRFPFAIPLGGINVPFGSDISFLDQLPFYLTQYTFFWLALAIFLTYKRLQ